MIQLQCRLFSRQSDINNFEQLHFIYATHSIFVDQSLLLIAEVIHKCTTSTFQTEQVQLVYQTNKLNIHIIE